MKTSSDNTALDAPQVAFIMTCLIGLLFLFIRFPPTAPIITYSAVFITSAIPYWLLCRFSLRSSGSDGLFKSSLLVCLVVRLFFLNSDPVGSDDIYRYQWDGRVQASGLNPYAYAPDARELEHLQTERLPRLVNHPEMKSIYFPFSQWLFLAGYLLSGEEFWGYKLLILAAEILTIAGLVMFVKRRGDSPWLVLLYAANPLILTQFSLDAHVDIFGFPLLIFSLLLYERRKLTVSAFLLGCSLLIKPLALVLFPFFLVNERHLRERVLFVSIAFSAFFLAFLPYMLSANPFEALATFSTHWVHNGALFSLFFPLVNNNQVTRLFCLGVLLVVIGALLSVKRPFPEKIVFAVLLLLLCSPVVHPWYFGWLVVLLPVAPIRSGMILAGTASLASITVVSYQILGVWKDYVLVLVLEYLPVAGGLWRDFRGRIGLPMSDAIR